MGVAGGGGGDDVTVPQQVKRSIVIRCSHCTGRNEGRDSDTRVRACALLHPQRLDRPKAANNPGGHTRRAGACDLEHTSHGMLLGLRREGTLTQATARANTGTLCGVKSVYHKTTNSQIHRDRKEGEGWLSGAGERGEWGLSVQWARAFSLERNKLET